MKSAEYWKKRFEQVEQSQHDIGVSAYADIEKQYRKAQRQIEGQINAWYGRFAKNNNVSLEEARRMLTTKELDELKWDVHEYIKYGQENALNGQWIKELENASARFHISRLEALQLQTQQSLEVMFGNQLDTIDSAMSDVYKSGFYRTAFEIQKGFGVGWDFASLDDKQIAKVINKPWAADGKNFSQRVWGNRTKLVNELNQTLTRNIVLGQDPQKAIDEIAKKMNTSKHNAGRLVMTEEAFFSSEAQRDCFKELDVEEYEIVATLDSHTSDICQDMDGKHFKMSQWEVGTTAPPFHVYCRSTTVPYFADDFGVPGERAARMADGEPTYHVPADMTYKQWQKSFLGGGDKTDLKPVNSGDIISVGASVVEQKPEEVVDVFNPSDYRQVEQNEFVTLSQASQKNITKHEKEQIAKHTKEDGSPGGYVATHNYRFINSSMRNKTWKDEFFDADDLDTVQSLRSAIEKNALNENLVFTRYVNADYLTSVFGIKGKLFRSGNEEMLTNSFAECANAFVRKNEIPRITDELKKLVDTTFSEKAFVSVSVLPNKNIMQDKAVMLQVYAPKGTHCYVTKNRKESEAILADGSTFLIKEVEFDDNLRKWILKVVVQ